LEQKFPRKSTACCINERFPKSFYVGDHMIVLKNGKHLTPSGNYVSGSVFIDGEKIAAQASPDAREIDIAGCEVVPGLIDIHTHGAGGIDAISASPGQLGELCSFYASKGVTGFMPTLASSSKETLYSALENISAACGKPECDSIIGVHIEGPYINPEFKGAHRAEYIRPIQKEEYLAFEKILGDSLKIRITLAPELPGSDEYIKFVCGRGGLVSIGHTGASASVCAVAIESGANSFTHVFNAMRGLHHREPGTVGSALLSGAFAELICDGIHLSPDIVRLAYRLKGPDGIVLITDSMPAAGLRDGDYAFLGDEVKVENGAVRTKDGTLAGSTLLLFDAVKNMSRFAGIPFETSLRMATANPARAAGIFDETGTIETGKRADLLVLDEDHNIIYSFCRGRQVHPALPC
jgi:N-acetylglucosamine-6-phosphate deacetylase